MSHNKEHSFTNSSETSDNESRLARARKQLKRGMQSTVDFIAERKTKAVAGAAGTAIAISALAGCSTGEAPAPKPTETSTTVETEEPTVEPTPTETAEPTPEVPEVNAESYTFTVTKEQSDAVVGMDKIAYDQLSTEESLAPVLYYMSQGDFVGDVSEYERIRTNIYGESFDALPAEPSPTNTHQEILAQVTAVDRLTFSVPDDENPDFFDRDVAFRLITGAVFTDSGSYHAQKLTLNLEELVQYDDGRKRDQLDLAGNGFLATPQVESGTELTTDENGNQSVDITYKTSDGPITETYFWVPIGDKGIWMAD